MCVFIRPSARSYPQPSAIRVEFAHRPDCRASAQQSPIGHVERFGPIQRANQNAAIPFIANVGVN
jgi:hypothetical protein